eukprot:jgi/Chlat1/2262/Chrsp17S08726
MTQPPCFLFLVRSSTRQQAVQRTGGAFSSKAMTWSSGAWVLAALWTSLLSAQAATLDFADGTAPSPPTWPDSFEVRFNETVFVAFHTTGVWFYDYAHGRSRMDRADGFADRYCGMARPLRSTPCTHLVRDGVRYLLFPEGGPHRSSTPPCCRCCGAEAGCGVVRPDWLADAVYVGQDTVRGITCHKWSKKGLQPNYYWETEAGVPVKLAMVPTTTQDFNPASFHARPMEDWLFELPPGNSKA